MSKVTVFGKKIQSELSNYISTFLTIVTEPTNFSLKNSGPILKMNVRL